MNIYQRLFFLYLKLFRKKFVSDFKRDKEEFYDTRERSVNQRVREFYISKGIMAEDVETIMMSFKTYCRWHREENIMDNVVMKVGRDLSIDGIPITIANQLGDEIGIRIKEGEK